MEILILKLKKTFIVPYYGWGLTVSRLQGQNKKTVYFLPLTSPEFVVLILLTSEEWKTESTLEPTSGFEHGTPGFGIQCFRTFLTTMQISFFFFRYFMSVV